MRSVRSKLTRVGLALFALSAPLIAGVIGDSQAGAAVTVVRHPLPPVDQSATPSGIAQGSDGNLWFTYALRAAIGRMTPSGVVTDFSIPTVNPGLTDIAAGPDGALWFTENSADKIGRITTAGVVTEYPLTSGVHPQFIAQGPDNAMWFSEVGARQIGRIAMNGLVGGFAIPGPHRGAEGITTGSDGALWSTDPFN